MKKEYLFIIIFMAPIFNHIIAQKCPSTGITFTTQKQIDNFPIDYPDCTNIKGNIRIEERNANNISNLNGLSQITSIEGDLKVSTNKGLTSLKGLNNLTSIRGQFGIWGNSSLEDISDLDNLISINGHLTISNNTSLKSLSGLNNLTFIEGFLRIKENDSLTSMDGLDNLFSIGKDFWVGSNDNLKNLNGLENLTSIKESLKVTDNKTLVDLNGLKALTFIGNSLKIVKNDSLINLTVLNNVASIGGRINISNNASLVYQNELDKLSSAPEKESQEVKENINLNRKNANDDRKWEFGVEAGFASIRLKKSNGGGLFDGETEKIKRSNKNGFRVSGIAKYNIDDRFQFIAGVGIIKAKGTANKKTTDSKGGFLFATVRTTINEDIIQNYTLIEIPVYLRMHLFGKNNVAADNFNIFFDLGASFKMPITNESFYAKGQNISTTTSSFNLFGNPPTTTTTSSYQEGDLELQSNLSGYFAIGFLLGDRTSLAFTYSGINTQGIQDRSIKYKSNLNSVAVTVFF